jgi:hypothetical protein
MTDDELTERLREIRLARRTPALPQKKTKKATSTTVISSSSLIDKLSPDQVAALLEKLGGTNLNLTIEEESDDGSDEDAGETEDSPNKGD